MFLHLYLSILPFSSSLLMYKVFSTSTYLMTNTTIHQTNYLTTTRIYCFTNYVTNQELNRTIIAKTVYKEKRKNKVMKI